MLKDMSPDPAKVPIMDKPSQPHKARTYTTKEMKVISRFRTEYRTAKDDPSRVKVMADIAVAMFNFWGESKELSADGIQEKCNVS